VKDKGERYIQLSSYNKFLKCFENYVGIFLSLDNTLAAKYTKIIRNTNFTIYIMTYWDVGT